MSVQVAYALISLRDLRYLHLLSVSLSDLVHRPRFLALADVFQPHLLLEFLVVERLAHLLHACGLLLREGFAHDLQPPRLHLARGRWEPFEEIIRKRDSLDVL